MRAGSIRIDGEDIAGRAPAAPRRKVDYVFQGIGIFLHMTVDENFAVTPRLCD